MCAASVGPRVLLRRLREVMAEPQTAQERLDRIVSLIAANMVAEVCSIYIKRPGDILELYATVGLNPQAVHETRLKVGEGLVGLIAAEAKPLSLSNAQHHPAFAYRPETGEEAYQSFLGVPMLRSGHTLGVLVIQNRTRRNYFEEEVEAMQTTAMVLAEIVASGDLRELAAAADEDIGHLRSHRLKGVALADGIALGRVLLHEPRVSIERLFAEDLAAERQRLDSAIDQLRQSIDDLLARPEMALGGEHRDVLEAYRMYAHDRGW